MRNTIPAVSGVCLAIATMSAWAAGNDELWAITTTAKMQGMTVPAMTVRSCMPKDGAYKPEADKKEKNCTYSDYKILGNTVTWTMQCTGKNPMTGSGEMTKTADMMKGTMRIRAQGMDMVQVMDGKRIGTCDAAAERKATEQAVAEIKASSDANVKRSCESQASNAVETGGRGPMSSMFQANGQCISQKPAMCEQLRKRAATHAGFAAYINNRDQAKAMNQPWGWALSDCNVDIEPMRSGLCQRALADKNYRFIAGFCPTEATQLNARECAGFGRDYTADMARPNAAMCRALRGRASDYRDADTKANAQADRAKAVERNKETENAATKAAASVDKLKKMFGF